jgi:hypothetical protein
MFACDIHSADMCELLEPLAFSRQRKKAACTGGVSGARLINGQTESDVGGAMNDFGYVLN